MTLKLNGLSKQYMHWYSHVDLASRGKYNPHVDLASRGKHPHVDIASRGKYPHVDLAVHGKYPHVDLTWFVASILMLT